MDAGEHTPLYGQVCHLRQSQGVYQLSAPNATGAFDWFQPFHKTGHIYKLYLHYCYLLGCLPKHTDYKPIMLLSAKQETSRLLREDAEERQARQMIMRRRSKEQLKRSHLKTDRCKIER